MYKSLNELFGAYGITNYHFVCEITGIPERTMQNWLRGYRKPAPYMIGLIEAKLNQHLTLMTGRYALDHDPTIFDKMRG